MATLSLNMGCYHSGTSLFSGSNIRISILMSLSKYSTSVTFDMKENLKWCRGKYFYLLLLLTF